MRRGLQVFAAIPDREIPSSSVQASAVMTSRTRARSVPATGRIDTAAAREVSTWCWYGGASTAFALRAATAKMSS
jgi:hypothetical protein